MRYCKGCCRRTTATLPATRQTCSTVTMPSTSGRRYHWLPRLISYPHRRLAATHNQCYLGFYFRWPLYFTSVRLTTTMDTTGSTVYRGKTLYHSKIMVVLWLNHIHYDSRRLNYGRSNHRLLTTVPPCMNHGCTMVVPWLYHGTPVVVGRFIVELLYYAGELKQVSENLA